MKKFVSIACIIIAIVALQNKPEPETAWIRINQLGYLPNGTKVAVWCSKGEKGISNWELGIAD